MFYIFWIYIAFDIVYAIWDTFVYIYKWIAASYCKEEEKKETLEMKTVAAESEEKKQDPPSKEPSKVECKGWTLSLTCVWHMYVHYCDIVVVHGMRRITI